MAVTGVTLTPDVAIWLGLTLAAVGFSFGVKDRQRVAVTLALAVLMNWALIQWTYADYSPQDIIGNGIKGRDLWPLFDGALGLAAVWAAHHRFKAAWFVFWCVIAQELLHEIRNRGYPREDYYIWLDVTWLAILLVFFVKGSGGVRDCLHRHIARGGVLVWSEAQKLG